MLTWLNLWCVRLYGQLSGDRVAIFRFMFAHFHTFDCAVAIEIFQISSELLVDWHKNGRAVWFFPPLSLDDNANNVQCSFSAPIIQHTRHGVVMSRCGYLKFSPIRSADTDNQQICPKEKENWMLTRFYFFCFSFAALVIVQQKYARKKKHTKIKLQPVRDWSNAFRYICLCLCMEVRFFLRFFLSCWKNKIHTVEIFEHFYACVKLIEPKYAQL